MSNFQEIIKSLLLVYLLKFAVSQTPPLQSGEIKQYLLMRINKEVNLTCPFTEVSFYKWYNIRNPSILLGESRRFQIKMSSDFKPEIFECEAINGFGKKSAIFVAKGIDVSSNQFEVDCKSSESGPCFLVSNIENDFTFDVKEGDNVTFDCRTIMNSTSNTNTLTYSWKKVPINSVTYQRKQTGLNSVYKMGNQMIDMVPPIEPIKTNNVDDMISWNSVVVLEKVSKEMDGIYMCSVSSISMTISRTFKLKVQDVKISKAIEGNLVENITAGLGETHTLSCKATFPLSKPKWGKKLEKTERLGDKNLFITWENIDYRILQGSLDKEHIANNGIITDAKYYENNLKLENIGKSDVGTYICSVLTRSNNPEIKFVYITLKSGETGKENNNFPLYIIVPIAVFVICLGTVLYCLIRRKLRQETSFKNRAGRGTTITTTNTSSANGSSSGSRNASNPRQHMLPTSTVSSKNFQSQYVPTNGYPTNPISSAPYGPTYPGFGATYTPAVMNYNYTSHGQFVSQNNTTPSSTEVDHPCTHHGCLSHNNQNVPYDSDTTPSPPPPTSVTDTISTVANNVGNQNMMPPYSMSGVAVNSYSPNQSSQVYSSHQPSQMSSNGSSSISTTNAPYLINSNTLSSQQPVYPIGNMYSA